MTTAARMFAVILLLAGVPHRPWAAEPGTRRCAGLPLLSSRGPTNSVVCLACHDGALASNIFPNSSGFAASDLRSCHPVLVSYVRAYSRNPSRFVSPWLLDARVKLVQGRVQCTTCHSVAADGKDILVMPNPRGELCFSCHRR